MANYGRRRSPAQPIEWHGSLSRSRIRTRCADVGCRHCLRAVANRSRRTRKEIAVINHFAEIAAAFDRIRSFDDIVTGVASIAFCACSAALFAFVFVGAI